MMKKSLKAFAAALMVAAVFGFAGCAEDDSDSTSGGSDAPSTGESADIISAGDIFMDDGTVLTLAKYQAYTGTAKAVAVSIGANNVSGKPLGVGLINSYGGTNSGKKVWAPSGSTGATTIFEKLVSNRTKTYTGSDVTVKIDEWTYYGNIDGVDDWTEVCKVDSNASSTASTNYPAFNYVNNYGITAGLSGTYVTGWYMPSMCEMVSLAQNVTAVNASLSKISGAVQLDVTDGFGSTDFYWTSSLYGAGYQVVAVELCDISYLLLEEKINEHYVCCIRAFN